MKKFIIGLLMLVLVASPCFANVRDIQDNYQLIYHIVDISGDHVGSETVALKIKRISDGYWYDFNDDTFKSSGWTSKSSNLNEDATEGYYYYTFNPPASETGTEQYLLLIDNASVTYGDHQSAIVSYQDIGDAVDADIDTQLAAIQTDLDSPNQFKATAADIWQLDISGYSGVGYAGTYLKDLYDNQGDWITAAGFSTHSAANVWTVGTRALTDKAGYSLSNTGVDAIWDEVQSGHTTAGTFGDNIDAEISSRATPSDVVIYVGQ